MSFEESYRKGLPKSSGAGCSTREVGAAVAAAVCGLWPQLERETVETKKSALGGAWCTAGACAVGTYAGAGACACAGTATGIGAAAKPKLYAEYWCTKGGGMAATGATVATGMAWGKKGEAKRLEADP